MVQELDLSWHEPIQDRARYQIHRIRRDQTSFERVQIETFNLKSSITPPEAEIFMTVIA